MAWYPPAPIYAIPGKGQNIALGAASVQNSPAFDPGTQMLRLNALGNCHVEVGQNPTATAASMLLKASDPPQFIRISKGDKIAVIQDGASTGNLQVQESTY